MENLVISSKNKNTELNIASLCYRYPLIISIWVNFNEKGLNVRVGGGKSGALLSKILKAVSPGFSFV